MKKIMSLFILTFILSGCFDKEIKDPNLFIKSENNVLELKVEHAVTTTQLTKGLQGRTKLAKRHGMLFDINPARKISMWMKDTLIPLDMIFVGDDNKIINITENTTPNSEEIISSGAVVRAVIEINAGEVKKYKIMIGDEVETDLIKKAVDNHSHNHAAE